MNPFVSKRTTLKINFWIFQPIFKFLVQFVIIGTPEAKLSNVDSFLEKKVSNVESDVWK